MSWPRLLGPALVAVCAWNAAFAATSRFGIFPCVGLASVVALASASTLQTPWAGIFAPRADALVFAAVATVVLVGATAVLRPILLGAWPALELGVDAIYARFGHLGFAQAYFALPLIAAAEELLFRGALQGALESRLGRWGAALGAAALYAVGHVLSGSAVLVALALVLGFFWGLLRAQSRSLWPGIASHVLWDLFVVVWAPWPRA